MQDNDCFLAFEYGIDGFMKHLKQSLLQRADLHLKKVSTPQNLMSFFIKDMSVDLQLRFVVVGQGNTAPLGRLSWLDQTGYDHVCCYVNDEFKCVARKNNGIWYEQKKRADDACVRRLMEIKTA